jgi:hypothetical protein
LRSRAYSAAALSLLLALAFQGCRKPERSEPDFSEACKAACAPLAEANCFAGQERAEAQLACVRACLESGAQSRVAGCGAEHLAYLGCVAAEARACDGARTPRGALDVELTLAACSGPARAYRACVAVCGERGVVRTGVTRLDSSGKSSEVRAELVGLGCGGKASAPPSKSPPGSACTHHSVCSAAVCPCPNGRGRFQARACVDARCAEPSKACELAPAAVGTNACGPAEGP